MKCSENPTVLFFYQDRLSQMTHSTSIINNKQGFQAEIDEHLQNTTELDLLQNHEKYVCIITDKMKIKEGLVFSKKNGNLLRFTDLGGINNLIIGKDNSTEKEMATTVLQLN